VSEELILQTTLKKEFTYKGKTLHGGKDASIRCLPSNADCGIVFKRVDNKNFSEIIACPQNVVSTVRCTSIGMGDCGNFVNAVEHLMAAFSITGIDNAIVEVAGDEIPAGDGSALLFAELIKGAGTLELDKPINITKIKSPVFIREKDAVLVALPYDGFRISYTLSYKHPHLGTLYGDYILSRDFALNELAPARTFGFSEELAELQSMGLAKGGSLENVVYITREGMANELRFGDEPLRHKVLDMIGDLYLNGRITGHFIGIKSGHRLNAEIGRLISDMKEV
jgi:UDP-3-O-[3-hydroxymyristoyl] N-acetylglucosamine deacetylase